MKAFVGMVVLCQCGYAMLRKGSSFEPADRRWLICTNPSCEHFGKKFENPSIELKEIAG